jgi:AcrR family transcriptional regulator
MSEPRFKRRKEQRPAEIAEAALAAFSENGYAATRVDDVARRAGVSKGLLYLYFKTKEELFKAVIRNFVAPKVTMLRKSIDESELTTEQFLRGPFLALIKSLPDSPVRIVLRLMIAEGSRHPDLIAFYWENVVEPGLDALRLLIGKGVANGEFRPTAVEKFPQLLISPVVLSIVWKILFDKRSNGAPALDANKLIDAHIDAMITFMKTEATAGATR